MQTFARLFLLGLCLLAHGTTVDAADLELGNPELPCEQDAECFNRLHPDIPMAGRATPGDRILLRTRNALNLDLEARRNGDVQPLQIGAAHPLAGPVHIEGAERGDTLAVTIERIEPDPLGITVLTPFAYAFDLSGEELEILWRLDEDVARSDALEGVAIPNGSFPGVVTTLPGRPELDRILAREQALAKAGGDVAGPDPELATPASLCGKGAPRAGECVRTIPPREHGGNHDIRYLGEGVTIYLPCFVDGCGLAVGDLHYAQGDGEVAGTAIEMGGDVTLTTRLIKGGLPGQQGVQYEGPSSLLEIPSNRFFATTGIPVKAEGDVPPEMAYLESAKVASLTNLSRDINLAARNALDAMLDHLVDTYGFTRAEAHVIASIAVDLRIAQLVDMPNVGVTAILPLDVIERPPKR
jgi:formamidase